MEAAGKSGQETADFPSQDKLMKALSSKQQRYPVSSRTPLRKRWSPTYAATLRNKIGVRRISTYRWWKSIFDPVLALLAIVILAPLLALIALAIRLDSPGSHIYRREQVGEDGRLFTAYKFRTMHINNDDREYKACVVKGITENASYKIDEQGKPVYKVINDPRVTRFGALLRKTNLDELPQIFNVLRGEMSLVGPRPDIPFAVAMYKDWHRERLAAKPGITGLWQVSGRKHLSFEDMIRLDTEYINRQSLLLDAKILWLTVGTVLRMDGS